MEQEKVVLLCVVGMSAAIVTETIWGLKTEHPEMVPDEVKLYTTASGWAGIQKALLEKRGSTSVWEDLQSAIGKKMELDKHVFSDGVGGEMNDIVTSEDQNRVADQLLKGIRAYKNPEQGVYRVVASIAGGRKSMSALMYAAMSLGAAAGDVITHVLVEDKYASGGQFFFPGQKEQKLETRDKQKFCAADVRIDLAMIPFVPLSVLVRNTDFRTAGTFLDLMQRARQVVEEVAVSTTKIRISRRHCKVYINDTALSLKHDQFVLMALMAEFAMNHKYERFSPEKKDEQIRDTYHSLVEQKKLPKDIKLPNTKKMIFEDAYNNSEAFDKVKYHLKQTLEKNDHMAVVNDALPNKKIGFYEISDIDFTD